MSLLGRQEYWDFFEPKIKAAGFELFDIDLPGVHSKVVRLVIWKGKGTQGGVLLDDCANVSKQISAHEDFEAVFPDNTTLEVSSPGINRRLRRPEHFRDAVGERVKLSYSLSGEASGRAPLGESLVGTITACDDTNLEIAVEKPVGNVTVPLASISKAHVDFLFK